MTDLASQLAQRIRTLRGTQTQRAFAKRLGIDHATLNRVEQGKENITLRTIQKICDHWPCTIGWLFDDQDTPVPPLEPSSESENTT